MIRLRNLGVLAVALSLAAGGLSFGAPAARAIAGGINGAGLKPSMGWSSWSFLRKAPTLAKMEAQADAMVSSGLAAVGYTFVNLDDFYYTYPAVNPGTVGMNVDTYGRWVTDPVAFPPGPNGEDGMKVLADYIHSKGLKFGIYLTPGIPRQAVDQNTPIEGTAYHAQDIVLNPHFTEFNYNQGVMWRVDFSKPGAQEYYNSIANRFASWGVDYLKYDGIRNYTGSDGNARGNVPDVIAMSLALQATGRPIVFDTTQGNQAIGIAPFVAQWASQTVFFPDIENGATSPALTSWADVSNRFDAVSQYAPFVGPGFHMDLDSVEVGSGQAIDGITPTERMTMMSLWALESSAWILGPDMTNLDPYDLTLLNDADVIAVDQDDIAATRIANTGGRQVFAKLEPNGDAIVGLFNTGANAQVVSTTAAALGLPASSTGYALKNLWTKDTLETAGVISAGVPSHGVALYRVSPISDPSAYPPSTTLSLSGFPTLTPGQTVSATESFTDNGVQPAQDVQLSLSAPAGWTVTPTSATSFATVGSGQTVQATFNVVAPATTGLATLTATANYNWPGLTPQTQTVSQTVKVALPVKVNEFRLRTTSNSTNQFVELFNAGTAPVDVGGWKVVYRSSSGTTDTTLVTIPAGTSMPGGGFYLIGRSGNGTTTGYLGSPTPNQLFTTSLSTSNGGVGVRDTTGLLVDSVGYGSATNAFVEGTATPAPPNTASPGSSAVRRPDGQDTDSNVADFSVSTIPSPGDMNQPNTNVNPLPAISSGPTAPIAFSASSNTVSVELWSRYRQTPADPWGAYSLATSGSASPLTYSFSQGDGFYEFYTVGIDGAGRREAPPATADAWTQHSSVFGAAHAWLGLKNGDDQGSVFDLRVELLQNGTPVESGIQRCISGVTRNAASAKEAIVPWDFAPLTAKPGDVLAVRFSARIGTNPDDTKCAGHGSATGVRFYYDSASRNSHFAATIGANPSVDLSLHSDGAACNNAESVGVTNRYLNTTVPGAVPAKCKDSGTVNFAGGNKWSTIGTWSLAPLP